LYHSIRDSGGENVGVTRHPSEEEEEEQQQQQQEEQEE